MGIVVADFILYNCSGYTCPGDRRNEVALVFVSGHSRSTCIVKPTIAVTLLMEVLVEYEVSVLVVVSVGVIVT